MKEKVFLLLMLVTLTTCNSRSGIGWENDREDETDVIVSDCTSRFVSSEMTILYTDGGVMVSRCDSMLRMLSLVSGDEITFSFSSDDDEGLESGRLVINGRDVELADCRVLRHDDAGCWLSMSRDGDEMLLVVADVAVPD